MHRDQRLVGDAINTVQQEGQRSGGDRGRFSCNLAVARERPEDGHNIRSDGTYMMVECASTLNNQ